MRILLSVPTYENIEPETFKSIYGLNRAGHTVLFNYTRGYDCARARNEIARECLRDGFDAVLMVDSDIVLPPDALAKLTDPTADVCLGAYPRKRTATGQSELFAPRGEDFTDENNIGMAELDGAGRIRVKGGGMGCALIRRGVFEAVGFPWFSYTVYADGSVLSEDLGFCVRAAAAGFPVYADARVRCGHVGKSVQWR